MTTTEDYLEDLRALIDKGGRINHYFLVTTELFRTPFIPQTEIDETRIRDAEIRLREYFGYFGDEPISLLEVLITLSIRTAHEIMGDEDIPHWFWLYFSNWGMDKLTDEEFRFIRFNYYVERYGRCFDSNRTRGIDIWKLMLKYLSDNFI